MSRLTAFTMPKWGIEMTEGLVAEWMVAEGQSYTRGEALTLVETDKITNEIEAEADGVMCRIVAQSGETLPVGALLAVTGDAAASADEVDAFISTFVPAGAAGEAAAQQPIASAAPAPAAVAVAAKPAAVLTEPPAGLAISPAAWKHAQSHGVDVTAIKGTGPKGRISFQDVDQAARPAHPVGGGQPVSIALTTSHLDGFFASPLAKRLAVKHDVDLATVKGTGPRGRIGKADVLALVVPAAAADVEIVPMSMTRKAIARQLTLSKTTIPHFYLRMSVKVDALQAMRERAKASVGQAPSINDYLVPRLRPGAGGESGCQCAGAWRCDSSLQARRHLRRGGDRQGPDHAGGARGGNQIVAQISAEIAELATRARANRLKAEEIQGGSFSLSNLGMFGIDQFDAIINPPQGAILAVGAAQRTPVETDYALSFATVVQLSLSCDHRGDRRRCRCEVHG